MLSQRAQRLKPSPTLALAAKAKELKAQGKDVISLSVGEPDWDSFQVAKEAGKEAIDYWSAPDLYWGDGGEDDSERKYQLWVDGSLLLPAALLLIGQAS